ncbi:MAG: DUF2784 domain-containing protein [Burkholderiales bacterium]
MRREVTFRLLADTVLALHVAVVLFVVLGLALILWGHWRGWRWADALWFRLAHLAAIGVVALQAWLGIVCPLTTLEMWLRGKGGQATYAGDFVAHWLQRLLYWDAPPWVFVLVYTLFGALVLAVWLIFPPRLRAQRRHEPAE